MRSPFLGRAPFFISNLGAVLSGGGKREDGSFIFYLISIYIEV